MNRIGQYMHKMVEYKKAKKFMQRYVLDDIRVSGLSYVQDKQ